MHSRCSQTLKSRWPLTDEDRVTLARFVSLHIVRTPAFGEWLRALGNKTAKEVLAEAAVKHELDEEQLTPYAERLASPHMHAQTLLRQVNRAASPLLSMHWSIIEFPEDSLIGCDQPVVLIPCARPDRITPASAIPPFGVMGTFEGRFTLDPRHVLLMTWVESGEEPWLTGDRIGASHINASLKAQAVDEWFRRPGTIPPFISAPLLGERVDPISPALFRGYTPRRAVASPRRHAAGRSVMKMVASRLPTRTCAGCNTGASARPDLCANCVVAPRARGPPGRLHTSVKASTLACASAGYDRQRPPHTRLGQLSKRIREVILLYLYRLIARPCHDILWPIERVAIPCAEST